ncbi:MAG: tRNA (N(6)-L-threonylcarbamoyladenosine(37)-C(2))-methylthiotransferase MtaB [Candidatus Kapabacteria bacterium]|nr:tRNA (N(6)-L-threonylcarbamoyladenosine(37)-C(2))-methylthiotransferase MtaB [Candidatus Kapabacteria bacterium]
MKVAFYTLGCKLNYSETSTIASQFVQAGHSVVQYGEEADCLIINTCTVTENADTEARKVIRRTLKHSPNAFVGVTGCYAQLQPEEIASIDGVDAVFGTKEKFSILDTIASFEKTEVPKVFVSDEEEITEFNESFSFEADSRTRAFLKIQDGCNYNCSFCTIPLARGASRSMPFDLILSRIQEIEKSGYNEIVLTGINLGDYSYEQYKFVDVIRLIESSNVQSRFRISSIEPNLLTQEILDIVLSSTKFCQHFHIPLQSGSTEILGKMRRRYKVQHYQDLIHRIKEKNNDTCIGVDVIVGFPGETNQHFEETFRFLEVLPVSYLHVFTYSERENTPAKGYEQPVPYSVRKQRTSRLRQLSELKKNVFYTSQLGLKKTVIPEKYDNEKGIWNGFTENYVKVNFKAPNSLVQSPSVVLLNSFDGNNVQSTIESIQQTNKMENVRDYIPILIS